MPAPPEPTGAAILAGGLSRRMGGGDKALRPLAGRTLLDRVITALRPQAAVLILNANGDAARFAAAGLPVVPDGLPDFPGPLAGALAALDWTARNAPQLAWVVTAPADVPFLPADLVARLHAARAAAGAELACAESAGQMHPVVALWPVAIRTDLRRFLLSGNQRQVRRFMVQRTITLANWAAMPYDPFLNVNTPDDLAAAEGIALQHGLA